ncbi:MAG: hypothetical protein ACRD9L_21895 [Bryobacteraceae bacterium]
MLPQVASYPSSDDFAGLAVEVAEPQFAVPTVAPTQNSAPLRLTGNLDVAPAAIPMLQTTTAPAPPVTAGIAGPGAEIGALAHAMRSLRDQSLAEAIPFPETGHPSWYPQKSAAMLEDAPGCEKPFALQPLTIERRDAMCSASSIRSSVPAPGPRLQGLVSGSRRPQIHPSGHVDMAHSAAAPQITLPGPKLPRQLERFEQGSVVANVGYNRGSNAPMPGWLITLSAMLTVVVACIAFTFYVLPALNANRTQSASPAPAAHPEASSPVAASAGPGKALEVTGFRVGVDLTDKTVIQYIVVNHSSADLSGATVNVSLKGARGHFQRSPLVAFSFRLPAIGPLESREMTTVLDRPLKTAEIPDWQTLRPEIQVVP